jgi:hypothetical protein
MGRRPIAADVNPLSEMLVAPRLAPAGLEAIGARLDAIYSAHSFPGAAGGERERTEDALLVFYHPTTLAQIRRLRDHLRSVRTFDAADAWLRMVALNRLTGHSPGFFSVYTLPPNQAVSMESQRRINEARQQTPPPRDVRALILRKTLALMKDGAPPAHSGAKLLTASARHTPAIGNGEVDLIVTSPPFLDVVNYPGDNWLRCWFAGIDPAAVCIDQHRTVADWQNFVRASWMEFARIVRPGGIVAFEVGEVRGGRVLLERHVVAALEGLPFRVLGVMVNAQSFTKTAMCWGVANNRGGTNSNRIVLAVRH